MSVRAQRERHEQLERERAVLGMRETIVAAIAPGYVRRSGSSAVHEAVDEALAQIVSAGTHLGEPEQVKALWITCARRRLIDDQRSAESRHRDATPVDEPSRDLDEQLRVDLNHPIEDARQEWRVREILSVLGGDQRIWAEAWYDEVLSGSRPSGAQPRGLGDSLGWTPAKTKSVSRRARARMAAFIDDRANGVICDERRALLDAFIMTSRHRRGRGLDDEQYEGIVFHLAGCDDCFAAWHTRRRSLPARFGAVLALPIDAFAGAAQACSAKVTCLAMNAYGQVCSVWGRLGLGGAAAAGGGAATIGAKATAVCVGVVCAATAGGEIAGVIPPIPLDSSQQTHEEAARPETVPAVAPAPTPSGTATQAATPSAPSVQSPTTTAPTTTTPAPTTAADPKPAPPPPPPVATETPGDLPSTSSGGSSGASAGSSAPSHAQPSRTAGATNCVPGSLGC
ncbi:MAG TPA: hypothetical protein VGF63_06000 [Solirubrobacteraceae bacterium]|jgi:DNA-directed RNA polymerase specialized sigma24 family protein